MAVQIANHAATTGSPSLKTPAAPTAPAVAKPAPVKAVVAETVVIKKKGSEVAAVIAAIKKAKGEKTIIMGNQVPDVRRIATGLFEFDFATGGGFPRGRYSIIYGPESSGKSNMCYLAAATAQKGPEECNVVIWVDLEHTFDPKWAARMGVDVDRLVVVKPGYGEEAVDIIDGLIHADDVALIVVDSLAMVVSSKEVEQSVEKFDVGTASILVKRLCNKVTIALSEEAKRDHDPAVIFVNQTRMKIGVMFGDPETMPGGQTMKFLSSLTVRVYGKPKYIKECGPDVPMLKETVAVIKKAKVGIIRANFNYDMALVEHGDLSCGESDSWTLVKNELQAAGKLVKAQKGTGWVLDGKTYGTLSTIGDTYAAEKEFAMQLQAQVIALYAGQKMVLDHSEKTSLSEEEQADAQ
jgi:recombination protein RecA